MSTLIDWSNIVWPHEWPKNSRPDETPGQATNRLAETTGRTPVANKLPARQKPWSQPRDPVETRLPSYGGDPASHRVTLRSGTRGGPMTPTRILRRPDGSAHLTLTRPDHTTLLDLPALRSARS